MAQEVHELLVVLAGDPPARQQAAVAAAGVAQPARQEPAQRIAGLLVDQLTSPVRFTQAAGGLVRGGVRTFVEVGPGNVLSGLVKRIDRSVKTIPVNSVAGLRKLEEFRTS